jgi:hypothetical protein
MKSAPLKDRQTYTGAPFLCQPFFSFLQKKFAMADIRPETFFFPAGLQRYPLSPRLRNSTPAPPENRPLFFPQKGAGYPPPIETDPLASVKKNPFLRIPSSGKTGSSSNIIRASCQDDSDVF